MLKDQMILIETKDKETVKMIEYKFSYDVRLQVGLPPPPPPSGVVISRRGR